MGATVQDVLEGDGEDVRLLGSSQVRDVSIERDALLSGTSLGNSQTNTEDGVGTKVLLVGSSIELVEELVNLGLLLHVEVFLDGGGGNDFVDVLNSSEDTYSKVIIINPSQPCEGGSITYPFRATSTCRHRGARGPRADLQLKSARGTFF